MHISRSGSEPSTKGPADHFTGTVRVDPLFQADAPARVASPATAMTHLAIQERLDGKAVDWLEHVTDDQYSGR